MEMVKGFIYRGAVYIKLTWTENCNSTITIRVKFLRKTTLIKNK